MDLLIRHHVTNEIWFSSFFPSQQSFFPSTLVSYLTATHSSLISSHHSVTHRLTLASIFHSFSSTHLYVLPPLTPFSHHLLLAFTPPLVISHPFVWGDLYLLPPSFIPLSFWFSLFLHPLVTLILPFNFCNPSFNASLPMCVCPLSIYLPLYQSIFGYLSAFNNAIWHPSSCPQVQSVFCSLISYSIYHSIK